MQHTTLLKLRCLRTLCCVWLCLLPGMGSANDQFHAASTFPTADLDLTVKYFNRELNAEGVLHESSYEEKMLRRKSHVWSERIIPRQASLNDTSHPNHEHKDFNYIVLPRHVRLDNNKLAVEFIDPHDRQVISIAPTEYENINFDGSWLNTYYLVNPQAVAAMPLSGRRSNAAHARWHEMEKNGLFQRVLWDDQAGIPLIVETGNKAGTFFQRIQVTPHAKLTQNLPWQNLQGFAQKEYSDFLD